MSEAAGRDVGTTAAARSYFDTVLPAVPQPLSTDAEPEPAGHGRPTDLAGDEAAGLAVGD